MCSPVFSPQIRFAVFPLKHKISKNKACKAPVKLEIHIFWVSFSHVNLDEKSSIKSKHPPTTESESKAASVGRIQNKNFPFFDIEKNYIQS